MVPPPSHQVVISIFLPTFQFRVNTRQVCTFGDLNPFTATTGTMLNFYIDDWGGGGQSVGFRVYKDGVDSLEENIPFLWK